MSSMRTVFIVEDDPAALSSLVALLTAFEYEVRPFDSAESFLAARDKTELGCLLTDVRLPGMTGLELQKALKMDGFQLPIILISGYADSEMKAVALENNVIALLEKPIDPKAIIKHIQMALEVFT